MLIFWIILGVLVLGFIAIYNSLIHSRNRVDEAWSDIEVQLKRRYDLIPNLVNTVKGYATHERSTLDEVIAARAKATSISMDPSKLNAAQMAEFNAAQGGLSQALGRLLVVAESYPDLKANQNFLKLQGDLTDTEDKIQAARRFFNANVRDYNTKIQTVPTNLFASLLGFTAKTFFDADDKETQPVNVQF